MTVAQLKKLLDDVEVKDDTPVYLYDPSIDTYFPLVPGRLRRGRLIQDAAGFHIDSPVPENPNLGILAVAAIIA